MSDAPTINAHPIAAVFPRLNRQAQDALTESVRLNGLKVPIVDYKGQILDGRNRYAACLAAGVEPRFTTYTGDNPLEHSLALNLARRQLSEGQRAIAAARVVRWEHGGDRSGTKLHACNLMTRAEAAKQFCISPRSIDYAHDLLEAAPNLVKAIEDGLLPLKTALNAATLDPDAQDRVVEELRAAAEGDREGRRISPMEVIRVEKNTARVNHQLENPSGKHRIIYADPPWDYGPRGDDVKSTADHYGTMSLEEIKTLPVRDWAEDDAVLFLWTTSAFLQHSFSVIAAWDFRYAGSFVWDKVLHNLGHYNSVRHEFLLIGARGSCEPDVRKQFDSVIVEERTHHSRKPAVVYQIIDALYPRGRRLEMFQRGPVRPGWEVWGLEAGDVTDALITDTPHVAVMDARSESRCQ